MNKRNAVKSMTGFGEAVFSAGASDYRLSVSSVNHRFLDISLRIPEELQTLEQSIRDRVRERINRGRVSVLIEKSGGGEDFELVVNPGAAKKYIESMRELSRLFDLKFETNPGFLLKLPGVVSNVKAHSSSDKLRKNLDPALKEALTAFISMREAEGENLQKSMQRSIDAVAGHSLAIKKRAAAASGKKTLYLNSRIREAGLDPSSGAFASEIVNLVNRMDINEEIVRLDSHILQFNGALSKKPSGIKLEFILQEILRESNTIGAKSQDAEITKRIIEIKTELQKLREQVQNIE